MIIDAHIHLTTPAFLSPRQKMVYARRAAFDRWPPRDPLDLLPRVGQGLADPDGTYTIAEMDRLGIDVMVPMMLDRGIELGDEGEIAFPEMLEHVAGLMQQYPGRLIGFAGVDPRRPGGLELFKRAVNEWGYGGLKFYAGCGFYPYDPVCYPYYELCQDLGLPVVFHTSPTPAPSVSRYAHPIHISDLHRDFPDLAIVYGHAGHGAWWEETVQLARQGVHGYLELSQWASDARKDMGGFIQKLGHMRDSVGAHHIIWASDFTFGAQNEGAKSPLTAWLQTFQNLPAIAAEHGVTFTQEEVDLMVGGNAQRLLRL